jgi:hypothetical protein
VVGSDFAWQHSLVSSCAVAPLQERAWLHDVRSASGRPLARLGEVRGERRGLWLHLAARELFPPLAQPLAEALRVGHAAG